MLDQAVPRKLPEGHVASLPAIYLAADYRWEWQGDWRSIRIGEPAPELDTAFPDAARFGMLTASNPGHLARNDADNRAADLVLQHELERFGLGHRPGFAMAPNRAWKAYNWLVVDPDVEMFDALGRRFGQIGTLLWSRGAPVRLRMHARPPEDSAKHPWVQHPSIDWIGAPGDSEPASFGENRPPTA